MLHGLKAELAARGVNVSHNAVGCSCAGKGCGSKKYCSLSNRLAPTSLVGASVGDPGRPGSIRAGSSSSTRPGSRPTWPLCEAGAPKGHACAALPRTVIGLPSHSLGALRHDQLAAPCVFDGPINGECFRAYVKHLLLPNLPARRRHRHSRQSRKPQVESCQADDPDCWRQALVPAPCSPDLNPIEQAFSKIKHWMRQAEKRTSRTLGATSVTSSRTSSLTNAPTTSQTPVMLPSKCESSVRFDELTMWVELTDGRTLGVPARVVSSAIARDISGNASRSSCSRVGLHWEAIDEDISVAGLLAGRGDVTRSTEHAA